MRLKIGVHVFVVTRDLSHFREREQASESSLSLSKVTINIWRMIGREVYIYYALWPFHRYPTPSSIRRVSSPLPFAVR